MSATELLSSETRVERWVENLKNGSEFHQPLAKNFSYYLNHVDDLESGALNWKNLPALNDPDKAMMDAAMNFGFAWGSKSELTVVKLPDGGFELFGMEENADEFTDSLSSDAELITVTATGRDPENDLSKMADASADLLSKVGECLEHLYSNEPRFWDDPTEVISEFPVFEKNTKMMVAYSALFGYLWELSDPYLFAVESEDMEFAGLYSDKDLAEEEATRIDGSYSRIVPVDNDQAKVRNST